MADEDDTPVSSVSSHLSTTPPPFTPPSHSHSHSSEESMSDFSPRLESKEFLITTEDVKLTREVSYLVIRSQHPLQITLPAIRNHQRLAIRITIIPGAHNGHTIVPDDPSETIQDGDSYTITDRAIIVSHKKKWYVF